MASHGLLNVANQHRHLADTQETVTLTLVFRLAHLARLVPPATYHGGVGGVLRGKRGCKVGKERPGGHVGKC